MTDEHELYLSVLLAAGSTAMVLYFIAHMKIWFALFFVLCIAIFLQHAWTELPLE